MDAKYFVGWALECSIYIQPTDDGLEFEELVELGTVFGIQRDQVQRALYAVAGPQTWGDRRYRAAGFEAESFTQTVEHDQRDEYAFHFVKEYLTAKGWVPRKEVVEAASTQPRLHAHDVEVAIAVYQHAKHIERNSDGSLRLSEAGRRHASPRVQVEQRALLPRYHQYQRVADRLRPGFAELLEAVRATIAKRPSTPSVRTTPVAGSNRAIAKQGSPRDILAQLFEELRGTPAHPWSGVDAWAAKARPLFTRSFPHHLADFDARVRKPPSASNPIEAAPMSPYGEDPAQRLERMEKAEYADARENEANARTAYTSLLSFVEGVLSIEALPTTDVRAGGPPSTSIRSFDETKRVMNSQGAEKQAFLENLHAFGEIECGPPSWEPDGVYRVGLLHGVAPILQRRNSAGQWTPAPMNEHQVRVVKEHENPVSPSKRQAEQSTKPDPRKVFVIHGRNLEARRQMGIFLQGLGLVARNFADIRSDLPGTATIMDVINRGMDEAQGVIALFTADEFSGLRPQFRQPHDKEDDKRRWQARPNVIFEAGLAAGKDPKRVVFVLLGDVHLFSDVAGVHVLRPTNNPRGDSGTLRNLLSKGMECHVDLHSHDWHDADFETCISNLEAVVATDPFQNVTPQPAGPPLADSPQTIVIRLREWLNENKEEACKRAIRFSEVDEKMSLPAGATSNHIETMLANARSERGSGYKIDQRSDTEFMLKYYSARDSGGRGQRSF